VHCFCLRQNGLMAHESLGLASSWEMLKFGLGLEKKSRLLFCYKVRQDETSSLVKINPLPVLFGICIRPPPSRRTCMYEQYEYWQNGCSALQLFQQVTKHSRPAHITESDHFFVGHRTGHKEDRHGGIMSAIPVDVRQLLSRMIMNTSFGRIFVQQKDEKEDEVTILVGVYCDVK